MAPLFELVLGKLGELAGKAVARGVDYAGRKIFGASEPKPQPLPWKDIELRREQERQGISHKVTPQKQSGPPEGGPPKSSA